MLYQAWKAERLMISGGSTSRCVFNVARIQTARNRLHCMSICQHLGDLCSSVTYYDKICEVSHTVDLSQCVGSRDGSYGTFIYQATSAVDGSEIEMYNTTSTTTSRYEGSTEIRAVMQRHARHNYSLTLGMFLNTRQHGDNDATPEFISPLWWYKLSYIQLHSFIFKSF